MSKAYTPDNLPDQYPVDNHLLVLADTTPGIDAHDASKYVATYRFAIRRYNNEKTARNWFLCTKAERMLRGIVAEGNYRLRTIKPLHNWD
jgi:hypothetical protein